MANDKFIHGYVLLDSVTFTEQDWEQFNKIKQQYFIEFIQLLEKDNRTLYYLVMRDENKLYDSVDEDNNTTYGILSLFSPRHPEIIGIWNKDGTELGTSLNITPATYDEKGNLITEEIKEIIGESKYPFNKYLYLSYIKPRIQYDEDNKEISRTEFYDIMNFSGFNNKINF